MEEKCPSRPNLDQGKPTFNRHAYNDVVPFFVSLDLRLEEGTDADVASAIIKFVFKAKTVPIRVCALYMRYEEC